MIINGGTGNGYAMQVNEKFQAETFSTIKTEIAEVSLDKGQAYVVSSGFIAYTTTASFSGMIYIKNTDSEGRDMFIEHIRVCATEATTDPCHLECKIIRNPTTGTLISGAIAGNTANSNFGSSNVFNGVAYAGADATTVTDGTWFTQFINHAPGHSVLDYNDSVILPKNSSIAILIKPCDALTACCEVNVHFK